MNIRKWTGIVLVVMLLSASMTAGAAAFTPGTYEASAQGFGGTVSVKLTVDEDTLDAGSFECPECGEVIDFENAAVEEVVFDDEDDEDEKD